MNTQKKIEAEMLNELKELGSEIRITEYNRSGGVKEKVYNRPIYGIRRLINFSGGYFPIYQNSSVTNMGYKITISIN